MKPSKKENICVGREYQANGETKKAWRKIGELVTWDDGRQSIEMFTMPNVKIAVFEQKERDNSESFN